MKKLLITILFSAITVLGFGQSGYITKDTIIGGWNARITYNPSRTDSARMFLMINGAGEVGTDTTLARVYLGHYWLYNGWSGGIILGNGTHYPVYVTLQPSAGYAASPTVLNPKVDALISRFKVKDGGLAVMGLSRGGWAWGNYYGYQATLGDFSFAKKLRVMILFDTQRPDDAAGAGVTSFPQKIGNSAANSDTRFWIVSQINGIGSGDMIGKNIQDSIGVTNRLAFFWTKFGSTGHSNFNDMCDPSQTNWTLTNPNVQLSNGGVLNTLPVATGQNVWQWAYRQFKDTAMDGGGGGAPTLQVNAGPDQNVYLPLSLAYLPGLAAHPGYSITSYTWSKVSGPTGDSVLLASSTDDTLKVHKLKRGVHTYRLTVTDSNGDTAFDDVNITVGDKPCNVAAPVTYYQGATQPGQIYLVGAAADALPWKGGDTVYIAAGNYPGGIQINKISGDKCRPIIIKPAGVVTTPGTVRFQDGASYFVLDGFINGVRSISSQTLGASMTSNFTLRGINVGPNPGGVGIYIKQDPYEDRLETYDGSYIMKNIIVDNIRIRNVEGEGMYIGNTAPNADPYHGNMVPIRLDSITISNCDVDSTGWDGIQLSNARNGNKIFNNKVRNFGRNNIDAQRAGIISGGNTNSQIYNNDIAYGTGNGLQIFGYGVMNVYDNRIDSVGNNFKVVYNPTTLKNDTTFSTEQSMYGLAANNLVESNPDLVLNIYNNTIIKPLSQGAMDFRRGTSGPDKLAVANVYNNTFCIPGANPGTWQTTYLKFDNGRTGSNNILSCDEVPPVITQPYFKGLFKF